MIVEVETFSKRATPLIAKYQTYMHVLRSALDHLKLIDRLIYHMRLLAIPSWLLESQIKQSRPWRRLVTSW